MTPFVELVGSFIFNFVVSFFIIRVIYASSSQNKNYVFTFLAFNTIIFFLVRSMTSIEWSIGLGFGLFAIFSVLRYRTDPLPPREMTYLFILIALPLINSVMSTNQSWVEMLLVSCAVISVLYILEKGWGFHYEQSRRITYDWVELIKPEHEEMLLADLQERTGLTIKRVTIGRVDFRQGKAELKIYYDEIIEQEAKFEQQNIQVPASANGRYISN